MSVIDKIRAKAAANVKHVVLAEGTEPRTVQAAAMSNAAAAVRRYLPMRRAA